MNSVVLTGRLTRDPDVRKNGDSTIARYTLAVDRKKGEEADFISCVSFDKTAELVQQYLVKGSRVAAYGRIRTGSYVNKDGVKVYTTDVYVNEVEFLDKKSESTPQKKEEPKQETLNDFLNSFTPAEDAELPFN